MRQLFFTVSTAVILLGFCSKAEAITLPPTEDTSGTKVFTGTPQSLSRTVLTSANGTSGSLPVSRTRTAFIQFDVNGISPASINKARLTMYLPSVIKAGDLNLHMITQSWSENFIEKTRSHPDLSPSFVTIPASFVVKKQFIILEVTQQVKDWLSDPDNNFGFAISSPDGIANVAFGSKEGTATGYPALLEVDTSDNSINVFAGPPSGMVLVPQGEFTLGNTVAEDTDITDANPVSAFVSAFYIDAIEIGRPLSNLVTGWAKTVGGYTFNNGEDKDTNHPTHTLSWYDAVKWCNARSEQSGRTPVYYTNDSLTMVYRTGNINVTNAQVNWNANGFRLPTEAEWEKAARGGLAGRRFPWGNTVSQKRANYTGSTSSYTYDLGPNGFNALGSANGTTPATTRSGSFAANGYGIFDMAGNVYEWCWDAYGVPYAGGTDPKGPALTSNRVIRGGSWGVHGAQSLRCASRWNEDPGTANNWIGFRTVLPTGQ